MPFKTREARQKYDRERYTTQHPKRGRPPTADAEKRVMFHGRVRASILGRMQALINEGTRHGHYPWKTMSELHEDMLLRAFESMKGEEFVDEMLPYLDTHKRMRDAAKLRHEAQAACSLIKTETAELLAIGDTDGAVLCFYNARQSVLGWSPGSWRDWLLKEIDKAFPNLVKRKPKPIALDIEPETDDEIEAEAEARKGREWRERRQHERREQEPPRKRKGRQR